MSAYEVRISDWSSYVCSSDLKSVGGACLEKQLVEALGGNFHGFAFNGSNGSINGEDQPALMRRRASTPVNVFMRVSAPGVRRPASVRRAGTAPRPPGP